MNIAAVHQMARDGRLYPGLILHGSSPQERRDVALDLARLLLCSEEGDQRPCGSCRNCRRVVWPGEDAEGFHPDFHVLERDLRTSTSADGTKRFLQAAYSAPFEARGQVFVIAEAETLTPAAADALLKLLEEPPERSPRHFLLLAASRIDLLPTVRSRSLSIYLGHADSLDDEVIERLADEFALSIGDFFAQRSAVHLLTAAEALAGAGGWEDPRARLPWATAAAAVLRAVYRAEHAHSDRRQLLALAEALLDAPLMRVRGITANRILEGLVSRHLGGR